MVPLNSSIYLARDWGQTGHGLQWPVDHTLSNCPVYKSVHSLQLHFIIHESVSNCGARTC